MQRGESREPVMTLVLTIVTCGFYYWYWMYKTCEEVNAGLGREEYNPVVEILLGVVTCGLWVLVWDWRVGESIYEMEQKWGVEPKMEPVLLFLTNFFGLGPLFYQRSMNNAWDNGRPPGGGQDLLGQEPGLGDERFDNLQQPGQQQPDHQPVGHDGTVGEPDGEKW